MYLKLYIVESKKKKRKKKNFRSLVMHIQQPLNP